MKTKIRKKRSEISREEWVVFNWVSVHEMEDDEPIYIQGAPRFIAMSLEAAKQWDEWRAAYEELHPELKQMANPPE